jgi:hypothetical protein
MDVDAIICLLCVQMWDHAVERLSWSEHPASETTMGRATGWGETTDGMRVLRGPAEGGEQARGIILMILGQGLHMLLRRRPGESSRIFVVAWRWCYRECPRACGHGFRMRESWSSAWVFHWCGGPWSREQQ